MNSVDGRSHWIKKGFSLLHAMEVMAREGAHRIAVLDDNDQVCGISTQSMIISLLSQRVEMLGPAKDYRIRDVVASLGSDVTTVMETERAIDAFRVMSQKRVDGLAVVNARGYLVDVISARDLRCIGTDGANWWRLFETVHSFKALTRMKFPQQTPRRPLYVTENDTLARVIEQMDDGNIHRVFQVISVPSEMSTSDNPVGIASLGGPSGVGALKPLRIISQRDAIRFVLKLMGMPAAASATAASPLNVPPVTAGSVGGLGGFGMSMTMAAMMATIAPSSPPMPAASGRTPPPSNTTGSGGGSDKARSLTNLTGNAKGQVAGPVPTKDPLLG